MPTDEERALRGPLFGHLARCSLKGPSGSVDTSTVLLPEPIKRFADTLCRSAREEDGFTIIEVLVSAVLVAMSAIGVFTALDSASATSGRDKAKNIAAQLAESDQERMRQMRLSTINNLRQTRTETSDGNTFTITSRADWVNDASGTQSCTGSNTTFDYLKIRSTVTWAGMGSTQPVVSDSLRSAPNGSFSSTQGSLAIQISDSTGTGLSGVAVSVSGAKNFSETTNANGCIFIGYIPAGTYTISFGQAGYVQSAQPNDSNVVDSVVIQGQQTASQQYLYDRAGTASVKFQTTTDVPGTVTDVTDTNVHSFSVGNTGLGIPAFKSFTGTTANTATGGGLFPFTSGYAVWAGQCAAANPPSNPGAGWNSLLTVPAGGTSSQVNVRMPLLKVTLTGSYSAGTGVVKIKPTDPTCTPAASYTLDAVSGTPVKIPLPYGTYTICGQGRFSSTTRRSAATPPSFNNTTAAGSAYSLSVSSTSTSGACP